LEGKKAKWSTNNTTDITPTELTGTDVIEINLKITEINEFKTNNFSAKYFR
jgi:hypothetical protein